MSKANWDTATGYQMFLNGSSDAAIGKAMGIAASTVNYYKKKHWLSKEPTGGGHGQPRPRREREGGTCYAA